MKAPRASYPRKPAPARLGYPRLGDGRGGPLRILGVVRSRKAERELVDPWTAYWMDRSQVAGSTFTDTGTRCAFLDCTEAWKALPGTDAKRRVKWDDVPDAVKDAVLAAIAAWNASAEYVAIGGTTKGGARAVLHNLNDLDFCGMDCPSCGGDDTLGAVGGRPLKPTDKPVRVRCANCGWNAGRLARAPDGDLVLGEDV